LWGETTEDGGFSKYEKRGGGGEDYLLEGVAASRYCGAPTSQKKRT